MNPNVTFNSYLKIFVAGLNLKPHLILKILARRITRLVSSSSKNPVCNDKPSACENRPAYNTTTNTGSCAVLKCRLL